MHVYRPTPTPGRPTSLSYVKKPTTLSSIVVADYSEGRLQISPDLSRVASPTDNKLFDSFGLVNPLSKIGSRGEDYYWEVTLLTNGLCQIGVACLSPEYRHLQFSPNPRGGAGVGDVSCSVGIDLSRSVCFLSGLGGRTKIALPYKWKSGDTLSFHCRHSRPNGRSDLQVFFTSSAATVQLALDVNWSSVSMDPTITLSAGSAVLVNIGQRPFRVPPPPNVRSFLAVVSTPMPHRCIVCNELLRYDGYRCLDCASDDITGPQRGLQGYCSSHFSRIGEDTDHAKLCHRWGYFNTQKDFENPAEVIPLLQPPEAYALPWGRNISGQCSFCRCSSSWCWLRSAQSVDLICCFRCFSPANEDMRAAMPWIAVTNPIASAYYTFLGAFTPLTDPTNPPEPVPSAYSSFKPNAPPSRENYSSVAPAQPQPRPPESYQHFDPKTQPTAAVSTYSRAEDLPASSYASSSSFTDEAVPLDTYSHLSMHSTAFDYQEESPSASDTQTTLTPRLELREAKVGSLVVSTQANVEQQPAAQRNWNADSLALAAMPESSPEEIGAKIAAFSALRAAFVEASSAVAKTVVSELALADDAKTIKPVDVGGVAGGTKFIHNGIFLKFAVDSAGIYGGNSFAAKSAALELRGLRAYLECNIPGLNIPLMAVLDYKGWTMIATPLLPITKSTLVYGSNDAGITVHKSDPEMNALMDLAAQRLNLKPHVCGVGAQQEILAAPTDIEGHRGTDGMYYVLDTARVFPPEKPFRSILGLHILAKDSTSMNFQPRPIELLLKAERWRTQVAQLLAVPLCDVKSHHLLWDADLFFTGKGELNVWASFISGHHIIGDALLLFSFGVRGKALYCLLRPELVSAYSTSLSSDAYTLFGRANASVNNLEVAAATDYIRNSIIPKFAKVMLELDGYFPIADLVAEMHKRGIPLRFLGALASQIENIETLSQASSANMNACCVIAVVACVRAFKSYVRALLRNCKTDLEYKECVVDCMNLFLGTGFRTTRFHETMIHCSAMAKFGKYGMPSWLTKALAMPTEQPDVTAVKFLLIEPFLGVRFDRRFRSGSALFERFKCTLLDVESELYFRTRTVYDDLIRAKEEALLEVSRMTGVLMQVKEDSQYGLTFIAWKAKRAVERNDWIEAEQSANTLRTLLENTPKYINVTCMLLYVEGCIAAHKGDFMRGEQLLWHAYAALTYSHPYIPDLPLGQQKRRYASTMHPFGAFILERISSLMTYSSYESRKALGEMFCVLLPSRFPIVRALLKCGRKFTALLQFISDVTEYRLGTDAEALECIEATYLKPIHTGQEYELDAQGFPISLRISERINPLQLLTNISYVGESVPCKLHPTWQTPESFIWSTNISSDSDYWPMFLSNSRARIDFSGDFSMLSGGNFTKPGTYAMCVVGNNCNSNLSELQSVVVLPNGVDRNPNSKAYLILEDDFRIPAPLVTPFLVNFQVKQVAANSTGALFRLASGEVYGFGNNSNGELGLGHKHAALQPTKIEALLTPVRYIAMTNSPISSVASAAVDVEGLVWLWGTGSHNICAGKSAQTSLTPRCLEAQFGCKLAKVELGSCYSFAIDEQARLWYWGECELTPSYSAIVPIQHPDFIGQRVASVSIASPRAWTRVNDFVVVINEDGTTWFWGTWPDDSARTRDFPKPKEFHTPLHSVCINTYGMICLARNQRSLYGWYPCGLTDKNCMEKNAIISSLLRHAQSTSDLDGNFFPLTAVPTKGIIVEMTSPYLGYPSDVSRDLYIDNRRTLVRTNLGEVFEQKPYYAAEWTKLNALWSIPADEWATCAVAFAAPSRVPNNHITMLIATDRVTEEEKALQLAVAQQMDEQLVAKREKERQEMVEEQRSYPVSIVLGKSKNKAAAESESQVATTPPPAAPSVIALGRAVRKPEAIAGASPAAAALPQSRVAAASPFPSPSPSPASSLTSVHQITAAAPRNPVPIAAPVAVAPAPAPPPPPPQPSRVDARTPPGPAPPQPASAPPSREQLAVAVAAPNHDVVSRAEFEELRAQVIAQQAQINVLMQMLIQKK